LSCCARSYCYIFEVGFYRSVGGGNALAWLPSMLMPDGREGDR